MLRSVACVVAVAAAALASPAMAQFYLASPDLTGTPVKGNEPGIGEAMPGATDAEVRAELVWNLRSALNVAALQCQFEPGLLSVENYNAVLFNHKDELKSAFDTLSKYFIRVAKVKKTGQTDLDRFGTRAYSSFTAVQGQFGFCQTASSIGRDAVYAPRGQLYTVASERMAELRKSLKAFGEQRFPSGVRVDLRYPPLPRLDPICWDKKGNWVTKKCGVFQQPTAA